MPLVRTAEVISDAVGERRGIGAFNVVHLETAEALADAAERAGLPVILQLSQNCVHFHGALAPIGLATLAIARSSTASIAVHLDHAEDEALVREAIDLGFGSVMFDGAALEYGANVAATARVVDYARERGAYVEAELGEIGGKDGAHAPGIRTDPHEAAAFVKDTDVDALAVAVGSSHAMTERSAALDLALIAHLHRTVPVPLVLHGSSGVSDEQLVAAIHTGMTKINVSTHLNAVFSAELRAFLADHPTVVDSRKYFRGAREALATEAARLIRLFALSGS